MGGRGRKAATATTEVTMCINSALAGGTISGNDWSSWKRAKHPPRPFSSGQTERRGRRDAERRVASRRIASHRWMQHGAAARRTGADLEGLFGDPELK